MKEMIPNEITPDQNEDKPLTEPVKKAPMDDNLCFSEDGEEISDALSLDDGKHKRTIIF